MIGGSPPADLCREHAKIWTEWAALNYNWRHPCEWPGSSIIMDNRTSHDARAADWDRKTRQQLDLVEKICRSGNSPQCSKPGELSRAEVKAIFGDTLDF
jgi:hypothetical protein